MTAVLLLAACAGTTDGQEAAESGAQPAPTSTAPDDSGTQVTPTTAAEPNDSDDRDDPPAGEASPVGVDVSCTACDSTMRSITIGGMGEDFGPPDRAVVEIGVSAQRPTVGEATQQASAAGASLVAALAELGVPDTDIQTSQFNIHPRHDQFDHTQIIGYQTEIGYRVTVRDVSGLGSVLGRAVDAGGDSVRAWSVGFAGDPDVGMDVARAEAWDDVRSRAAATADQIGAALGEVLDVHEKVLVTSPHGMRQGGEGDSAPFDVPTSPGVVGVIVLLTVTYAIGE
ncbi:SIMPL domain-containing protein [Ilumatobacter sp.]|uniref:SIMPL domain-containing protein n=1 Tax=Ilumatobacter sp. TaxID=1967498 RepID=UPI003AF970EE